MTLVQTLFGFQGRIRRRDWWLWSIASAAGYIFLLFIAGTVVFGNDWSMVDYFAQASTDPAALAVEAAAHPPLLWIQCALAAKRSHDRGTGAAVAVVLTVLNAAASYIPALDYAAAGAALDLGQAWGLAALALGLINLVGSLYLLIVLGFLDGTRGPNRFGPSPKGLGGGLPAETARVFE